jgi:iron complex transport system substrate-binding protein
MSFALIAISGCRSRTSSGGSADASAARPTRVVTLTPSATEMVAAVGGLDRLVGVDNYSEHPAVVRSLPRLGDFLQPDVERIVRLRPDLVVLDAAQGRTAEGLASAGVRTLVLTLHNLNDVHRGLTEIGAALGTEAEAGRAVAALESAEADARRRAAARPAQRPRVLFAIDRELGSLHNLIGAGPGTFVDDLLEIIGADNVLRHAHAKYPKLSPEEVIRAAPDVILDGAHGAGGAEMLADWKTVNVPAVRRGRVFAVVEDSFVSPGPRLPAALARLETLVHGTAPPPAGSGSR